MITIRFMTQADYEQVFHLWSTIAGFGIRSIDDSYEGVSKFLERNPGLSVVAVHENRIVGSILVGHDGRQASFYHVCVDKHYRKQGICKAMAVAAMEALKQEGINKITLVAFCSNERGNEFWQNAGWAHRNDFNYYDFLLNSENITQFMKGGEQV